MNEIDERDDVAAERVAETVRRALDLVGPAESSAPELVTLERPDQPVS
jgi:hypothetical protein